MKADIRDLKKLASEAELEVIEYHDGRILVVGGIVNVHWWPDSKRKTAYAEGSPRGKRQMTAKQVVRLATKGEA